MTLEHVSLTWLQTEYNTFNLTPPTFLGDGKKNNQGWYNVRGKHGSKAGYAFDQHDGKALTVTFHDFRTGYKASQTFTLKCLDGNFTPSTPRIESKPLAPPKEPLDPEIVRVEIQKKFDGFIKTVGNHHPYLTKKQVPAVDGLRFHNSNLIVPAYQSSADWQAGRISTYQQLLPKKKEIDGDWTDKIFKKDGISKGTFFPIGLADQPEQSLIYLVEGYATGATVHQNTGQPTIVAFNAGNLLPVAIKLRAEYPNAHIKVAADDDRFKELDGKGNAGRKYAEEVCRLVPDTSAAFPDFDGLDLSNKPTDFNDLYCLLTAFQQSLGALGNQEVVKGEMLKQLKPQALKPRLIVEGRYLPDLDIDNFKTIFVKTQMGTGKTEATARTLQKRNSLVKEILLVLPRQSLVESSAVRYKAYGIDLADYRGKIDGTTKAASYCVNSISKHPYTDEKLQSAIIVIDECEQALQQLATMTKPGATLEGDYLALCNIIKLASILIISDAYLSDLSISLIKRLRPDQPMQTIESTYQPGKGSNANLWLKKALLNKEIEKCLATASGQGTVLIPTDSINLAKEINARLKDLGYNGLAITGETKNDERESLLLTNPDSHIPLYQYVIYSPAISGGVSFNTDALEGKILGVYGFFSPNSGPTPEDAMQQLGRYRGLMDWNIFIENRTDTKPTTTGECLAKMDTLSAKKTTELTADDFRRLAEIAINNPTDASALLTTKLRSDYTVLQAEVEAKHNRLCNNFGETLVKLLIDFGKEVVYLDEYGYSPEEVKQAKADMKAAKALATEQHCQDVVNAPDITKAEAITIERDHNAKSYDFHALEKYQIKEFYGEATPEIVRADKHGKLRKQIKGVLRIMTPDAQKRRDIDDIIALANGKLSMGHMKAHKLFCDVYRDMLDIAGYSIVDGQIVNDDRSITRTILIQQGFVKRCQKAKKHLQLFHVIPEDLTDNPMQYLQTFLADLGLELNGRQKKCGGKIEWFYKASITKIGLINELMQSQVKKLRVAA